MPHYHEMYLQLFNTITDVIEELQQVQKETERLYIESEDAEIVLLKPQANPSNASRN